MPTDRELMQQAAYKIADLRREHTDDATYEIEDQIWNRLAQCNAGEICLGCRVCPDIQPEQDGECSYCDGAGCAACDARVLSSEPVAWMLTGGSDIYLASDFEPDAESLFNWTPLFTAPPQRDWAGLTTAETKVLWNLTKKPREYAQAIEAKLKERNT